MDCKEVGDRLYLFFDNEMEEELRIPFRDHVGHCVDCARRLDYTRKLLCIVRERTFRCVAPDGLRHRILISFEHRRVIGPPH